MNIEHSSALPFIYQGDLFLSDKDRDFYIANKPDPLVLKITPVILNYLGGNKKEFLIVVYYPEEEFIKGGHLTALQSILKRMEFAMDDVAIFNKAKYPGVKFMELDEFFHPKKSLLLGNSALPGDMEAIPLNVPVVLNNISTLYSFSFDEMIDNTFNKKVFWEQVKQL